MSYLETARRFLDEINERNEISTATGRHQLYERRFISARPFSTF